MVKEFCDMGYDLFVVIFFKFKYVEVFVEKWLNDDKIDVLICNWLMWLCWWVEKINKFNVV